MDTCMNLPAIEVQKLIEHPAVRRASVPRQSIETSVPTRLTLNSPDSRQRASLEQFIADKFNTVYGASIVEFFPLLLSRFENEQLTSVVGLRPGTVRPLFLEQYLKLPLETAIANHIGEQVERERLMEIGNLASSYRSGNHKMFVLLTAILAKAGYTWVVFTATAQVRSLLKKLDFHPVTLCAADPSRLVNKHQVWGSYYQAQPLVQAGNVAEGMAILEANSYTSALLRQHAAEIDALARQLSEVRLQQQGSV